jgi:hypothetical protein
MLHVEQFEAVEGEISSRKFVGSGLFAGGWVCVDFGVFVYWFEAKIEIAKM